MTSSRNSHRQIEKNVINFLKTVAVSEVGVRALRFIQTEINLFLDSYIQQATKQPKRIHDHTNRVKYNY